MLSGYLINLSILICIYLILAISLQIALGFTGLFNLGHIAFFCFGAYTFALSSLTGCPFWFSFLSAALITMIFGEVLSALTNKLKGDYLAIATLAFSFVIYSVALNWTSLTRGPLGLPGIPRPIIFMDNANFLIIAIISTVLTYFITKRIASSPYGKVLQAVRDNQLMAQVLGKNSFKIKTDVFMLSAFFAGIAGSLYASYVTFIDPSSFTLTPLILLLTIVIIGGLGSFKGTLIATAVLMLLPELLRFIGLPSSIAGPTRQIIYSLMILAILIYRPMGFYGKVKLE
jgi:branched-chain amino acid transport system permease protein